MKYINIIVLLFVLIGCKKHTDTKNKNLQKNHKLPIIKIENKIKKIDSINIDKSLKTDSLSLNINEILDEFLVGMEFSENKNETNPYKKYSLDLSSACYSCDLASFKLKKDEIIINNYCDPDAGFETISILKTVKTKYKIELRGDKVKFIFNKIDNAPIYNMKIEGNLKTKLKINKNFTKQSSLEKFEVHDCGNFEG